MVTLGLALLLGFAFVVIVQGLGSMMLAAVFFSAPRIAHVPRRGRGTNGSAARRAAARRA